MYSKHGAFTQPPNTSFIILKPHYEPAPSVFAVVTTYPVSSAQEVVRTVSIPMEDA